MHYAEVDIKTYWNYKSKVSGNLQQIYVNWFDILFVTLKSECIICIKIINWPSTNLHNFYCELRKGYFRSLLEAPVKHLGFLKIRSKGWLASSLSIQLKI